VYSSSDGVNWEVLTESAPCRARVGASSIVYNNEIWIIGGYLGFGQSSNDVWVTKMENMGTDIMKEMQFLDYGVPELLF